MYHSLLAQANFHFLYRSACVFSDCLLKKKWRYCPINHRWNVKDSWGIKGRILTVPILWRGKETQTKWGFRSISNRQKLFGSPSKLSNDLRLLHITVSLFLAGAIFSFIIPMWMLWWIRRGKDCGVLCRITLFWLVSYCKRAELTG